MRGGAAGSSNSSSAWARSDIPTLYHPTARPRRGPASDRCLESTGSIRMRGLNALEASMGASRSFPAVLAAALAACGSDPAGPGGGVGQTPYTLALVGGPEIRLHPGEERTLYVLLAADGEGPVANGHLRFAFAPGADPGGSRLDTADAVTDEDGIGRVRLIAGPRLAGPFRLSASAPDL